MADKQMIIDGVDVSKCEYYNKEDYPFDCDIFDCNCSEKNCHYKQLHRYKQAFEEIEEIVIDFKNSYGTDYKEMDKIIQKCEEVNE